MKLFYFLSPLLFLATGHAATLVVDQRATNASDTNAGTIAQPFKTIEAASQVAKSGDVISVRPGVYREAVRIRTNGVTYESAVPHQAVIDGADVITNARADGGDFTFPAPDLSLNPYATIGGQGPWLYVNGEPLAYVSKRADLKAGAFLLDFDAKQVRFQLPETVTLANAKLEFARRQGLISAPQSSSSNFPESRNDITVRGFTVLHNADWFRGLRAISFSGERWLIENNIVRWSSYGGIDGNITNHCIVRGNLVEHCGNTAIFGGISNDLLVENNRFLHSNWQRIDPNFEGGGSKWSQTLNSRFLNNEFAYHYGYGLWLDVHNVNNLLDGNVCHDNLGGAGVFTEISNDTTFSNNVAYRNNIGLQVGESAGSVLNNNITFGNGAGIVLRGDGTRENHHDKSLTTDADTENLVRQVSEIPNLDATSLANYRAKYLLYWVASPRFQTSNNLVWNNLSFNNRDVEVHEDRDYTQPSPRDALTNNFSDFNVFYNADATRLFHNRGGNYGDLSGWQKVSGRDARSQVLNPLATGAKLPDWAEAKRAIWAQGAKTRDQIDALNLGFVDSPSGAEARARFFESPTATRVKTTDPNLQAWLLDVDGARTLAVWTTNASARVPARFRVGVNSAIYESPFNVSSKVALANNAWAFTATHLPRYLRGVAASVTEAPLVALQANSFNVPGAPVSATARFSNETRAPQKLTATFAADNGFRVQPSQITRTLKPGERAQVALSLVPDGKFARGTGTLKLNGQLGSETLARTATFLVGEGGGKIARAPKALAIDGKLNDWALNGALVGAIADASQIANGDASKWSGAADLSAKFYAAYTPDALYIAAQVTDANFSPAPVGGAPYDADSIEFFVDGRDPAFQYNSELTPGTYQIMVSPSQPANVVVLSKLQLQGLQTATTRTTDGYIVEMKIPLSLENFPAGDFRAGRPFRMSLLINDRDESNTTRENALGYSFSPKGNNFSDASGWKLLTLG